MRSFQGAVLIFLGSGIGALVRYWMGQVLEDRMPSSFPAIGFINLVGSLGIGFAAGCIARYALPETYRLALIVGVLGGFTTFSSLSLQLLQMIEKGRYLDFAIYAGASIFLGILFCAVGFRLSGMLPGGVG